MSDKVAVVGIGNTLRRDDGIGIVVLEFLTKFHKKKGIDYFDFGSASFDLINYIQSYDAVILIDAIKADLPLGELKIAELDKIICFANTHVESTHGFDLKNVFEICKTMEIKTKVFVAGISVKDVSYGEKLSTKLDVKVEDIALEIDAFLEDF